MEPKPYYETPPDAPSRVRLYHGDCRELMPIVAAPSKQVIVLADGPYNARGKAEVTDRKARKRGAIQGTSTLANRPAQKDWAPIHDDDRPFDPSFLMVYERLLLWGADHFCSRLPDDGSWIVWDKRAGNQDDGSDCELAWTNLGGPRRVFWQHIWRGTCRASETGTDHLHPTQKPEAFYRWLYAGRGRGKPIVSAGDLIAVPYAGSGPEVAPAMELGLEVVAFDVVREYLDTIIKHRIEPALKRGRQVKLFDAPVAKEEQVALF